jgi:Hsp20/alpha crystallin family
VFDRTLVVPMQIDPDGIKAEYNDGLLAIFIAKRCRNRPARALLFQRGKSRYQNEDLTKGNVR